MPFLLRTSIICLVFLSFVPVAQAQILTGYALEPIVEKQKAEPAYHKTKPKKPKAVPAEKTSQEPVDLQANKLVHDENNQIITASGNVMLEQSGRLLRADQVAYNLKTDTAVAKGNVVLNEINGDIHYADEVTLSNQLRDGFANGIQSLLTDGSRFKAAEGQREGGKKTIMQDASYTPCEPCKEKPDRVPPWQIVASEVTHDEEQRSISYKHARFEIFGVPIAYTPFFAHPDGSIKRKSGLLAPSVGFKSELGWFMENSYYWNIVPDKDATIGLVAMTDEAPLAFGEWRQRWEEASLMLRGGVTHSERITSSSGVDERQNDEIRGHVLAEGLWNINNKWRSGIDIEWASDDQYMRQYDFLNEDVLESQIYLERFSGRNYAAGRLLAFQDIRVGDTEADQPDVLPEIIVNIKGEPGAVQLVKGQWTLDGSILGLRRGGEDQDMSRASIETGWGRRFVSDYGLLTTVNASVRGDFYNARDRDVATPGSGRSDNSTETRAFVNTHIQASYPVAKQFENMQATVEPVVALTVANNVDVNSDIPNEDSQDVQIDASNLFEANRFPGLDRVEDKSRITYGVRAGLYGYEGSKGDVFLGQSYRLDDDDNPFPQGSGLDRQESDIVGQVSAFYKNDLSLDYRFQLDSRDLTSQRHEVDLDVNWDKFSLGSRYLFAKALEGTEITESREQLQAGAGYHLSDDWRLRAGGTQDLGENPGLRRAHVGLDYFGQCVSWSITGQRNLTDDESGDSETEILFRIGLKNLGEFTTSGLRVSGGNE